MWQKEFVTRWHQQQLGEGSQHEAKVHRKYFVSGLVFRSHYRNIKCSWWGRRTKKERDTYHLEVQEDWVFRGCIHRLGKERKLRKETPVSTKCKTTRCVDSYVCPRRYKGGDTQCHQPSPKWMKAPCTKCGKEGRLRTQLRKPRKETQINPKCKTTWRMEATLNEKQAINQLKCFKQFRPTHGIGKKFFQRTLS